MSDMFNNTEELRRALIKDLQEAVIKEVVKEMKDIEREVIEERVYAVFSPKEYERRYANGGLMDEGNMQEEVSKFGDNINIEIANLTQGNSKYRNYWVGEIQDLIEAAEALWEIDL